MVACSCGSSGSFVLTSISEAGACCDCTSALLRSNPSEPWANPLTGRAKPIQRSGIDKPEYLVDFQSELRIVAPFCTFPRIVNLVRKLVHGLPQVRTKNLPRLFRLA